MKFKKNFVTYKVTKKTLKTINTYNDFIYEHLQPRRSAGLAIFYQGKILLAHTAGRKPNRGYGIPKGGIEPGESEIQAAIRETYEETGIKVPIDLIDNTPFTFVVTSRDYKYNKVVTYFIVEIENLQQIGLKTLKVPKSQLQIDEIDDAVFLSKGPAFSVIMKSQVELLNKFINKGLLR